MMTSHSGLRTTAYKVSDLQAAKEWYSKAFNADPYFDEPFYVGFSIGGYELGLLPEEADHARTESVLSYWAVENIQKEYTHLLGLGAEEHEKPTNYGEDLMLASVWDPWNNLLGIIYNPYFKIP